MRYIIEHMEEIDFDAMVPMASTLAKGQVAALILQQDVTSYGKRRDQYIWIIHHYLGSV